MKKVIIALDYDPSAEKVARLGYDVAKAMNASIMLLHVVNEPSYYESSAYSPIMGFVGFSAPDILEIDRGLYNEAQRFLDESKKHLGDDNIETSVLEGDFSEAIYTIIENSHADLLVMGTHSRSGIEKLLIGNLAEKILNRIRIPLLAIPTHNEDK
ncbi:MAG TPA: universal stress protein [Ferruginibacter sp.]|nr:universal stress protein [Ferruginibacter sp.]HPH90638.1 universal stress protein [Ferruginibacter sp.]